MAIADNGDIKVFRILRGGGYAEKVAGWLWWGWSIAVDDEVGGPEGVTDAGKAWLSSLPARIRGGLHYHL
jgi:hypothetical protein